MNMKNAILAVTLAAAMGGFGDAVPVVSEATMVQPSGTREVTITYTLSDAAAIVTLDVQTNATDGTWASIGGENVQFVTGDVWKKVEVGERTITWRPDLAWPGHKIAEGGARAVVTAWSVDNPPDYMVVDLSATGGAGTERYYPAVEFLPGGILGNEDYRLGKLVMRKVSAKGVTWQMGSAPSEAGYSTNNDKLHEVTLADSYYIGVFEVTQTQYYLVQPSFADKDAPYYKGAMSPMEKVCYNEIRAAEASTTGNTDYDYPNDPYEKSFLGLLRAKTGLRFDLPSEAQWEFACRAGHGVGFWGDGSPIVVTGSEQTDANLDALGFYNVTNRADQCTMPAGSYKPNDWGLYDMYGNVSELCLDQFFSDITGLNGAVNTTENTNEKARGLVARGGRFNANAQMCRSAARANTIVAKTLCRAYLGFRLAVTPSSDGSFHVQ